MHFVLQIRKHEHSGTVASRASFQEALKPCSLCWFLKASIFFRPLLVGVFQYPPDQKSSTATCQYLLISTQMTTVFVSAPVFWRRVTDLWPVETSELCSQSAGDLRKLLSSFCASSLSPCHKAPQALLGRWEAGPTPRRRPEDGKGVELFPGQPGREPGAPWCAYELLWSRVCGRWEGGWIIFMYLNIFTCISKEI